MPYGDFVGHFSSGTSVAKLRRSYSAWRLCLQERPAAAGYLCTSRKLGAADFETYLTPVTAAKIRPTQSIPAIADKIKRGSTYAPNLPSPIVYYSTRINFRFKSAILATGFIDSTPP
jgi:hypothetical protein